MKCYLVLTSLQVCDSLFMYMYSRWSFQFVFFSCSMQERFRLWIRQHKRLTGKPVSPFTAVLCFRSLSLRGEYAAYNAIGTISGHCHCGWVCCMQCHRYCHCGLSMLHAITFTSVSFPVTVTAGWVCCMQWHSHRYRFRPLSLRGEYAARMTSVPFPVTVIAGWVCCMQWHSHRYRFRPLSLRGEYAACNAIGTISGHCNRGWVCCMQCHQYRFRSLSLRDEYAACNNIHIGMVSGHCHCGVRMLHAMTFTSILFPITVTAGRVRYMQ